MWKLRSSKMFFFWLYFFSQFKNKLFSFLINKLVMFLTLVVVCFFVRMYQDKLASLKRQLQQLQEGNIYSLCFKFFDSRTYRRKKQAHFSLTSFTMFLSWLLLACFLFRLSSDRGSFCSLKIAAMSLKFIVDRRYSKSRYIKENFV